MIFLTARPMPGPPDDGRRRAMANRPLVSNVRRRSLPHTLPARRQVRQRITPASSFGSGRIYSGKTRGSVCGVRSAWACPPSANMGPDPADQRPASDSEDMLDADPIPTNVTATNAWMQAGAHQRQPPNDGAPREHPVSSARAKLARLRPERPLSCRACACQHGFPRHASARRTTAASLKEKGLRSRIHRPPRSWDASPSLLTAWSHDRL